MNCFKHIKNILSQETQQKALSMALQPGAFMDNSYLISFFRLPSQLVSLNIDVPYRVQMIRQTAVESKIHKDRNRHNEFDGSYIPRCTIMNFPLVGSGETHFYDDDYKLIAVTNYQDQGAILNTGEHLHNVILSKDETRICLQFCFEENFDEVCQIYDKHLAHRCL